LKEGVSHDSRNIPKQIQHCKSAIASRGRVATVNVEMMAAAKALKKAMRE
jgi:hypothetical protein